MSYTEQFGIFSHQLHFLSQRNKLLFHAIKYVTIHQSKSSHEFLGRLGIGGYQSGKSTKVVEKEMWIYLQLKVVQPGISHYAFGFGNLILQNTALVLNLHFLLPKQ